MGQAMCDRMGQAREALMRYSMKGHLRQQLPEHVAVALAAGHGQH